VSPLKQYEPSFWIQDEIEAGLEELEARRVELEVQLGRLLAAMGVQMIERRFGVLSSGDPDLDGSEFADGMVDGCHF
jgi:hypothetical protein